MRAMVLLTAGWLGLAVPAHAQLAPADKAAAMQAAGFTLKGGQWVTECAEMGGAYEPGAVEMAADLNGDGRAEAIVTEGGSGCYGNTGAGFRLMSRQADGRWRKLAESQGIATILKTKGAGVWPDIEVGGPGFCFPVLRWNGTGYVQHRIQYQGKPCRG